jgi:hypothetical protein
LCEEYRVFQKTAIWSFVGENFPKNFSPKLFIMGYFYSRNRFRASKTLENAS